MRLKEPLHISGTGFYIPKNRIDLRELLTKSLITAETFQEEGLESLSSAGENETVSSMAMSAVEEAIRSASLSSNQVGLILFSSYLPHDLSGWSQAADVAGRLGVPRTQFLDLYQGCNGILASVEVAMARLSCDENLRHVLIASSELLPEKLAPKHLSDTGSLWGDGAGACILSRGEGPLQILSLHGSYDADFNDLLSYEYGSQVAIRKNFDHLPFNLKETKRVFFTRRTPEEVIQAFAQVTDEAITNCLADLDLALADISFLVVPNYGRKLMEEVLSSIPFPIEKTSWEFGQKTGHIGCVDPIANLARLSRRDSVKSGDYVLILSHGAGISAMGAVLQV